MSRCIHLLPLLLLVACGKKDDDTSPGQTTPPAVDTDTGPYFPPTDTDPPVTATEHCPDLGPAAGATVVQPGSDIQAALDAASAGSTVALASGTHTITAPLVIRTEGVTLRGESGVAEDTTIDGGYVAATIVHVAASDVTVAGLTVTGGASHGVVVEPESADITGVIIDQLIAVDEGREHIVVRANPAKTAFADYGEIRCSTAQLTDTGREEVVGLCETGGIQVRRARGWTVRDNHVEGFWCEFGESRFGIELSEGTRDAVVERNMVVDTTNGITLGVGNVATGRTYDDAPCEGAVAQDYHGIVQNNVVYVWEADLLESESAVQVGLAVESACETLVVHNTVYSRELSVAAIDMRFATTTGVVANNLTNGTVRRQDGAAAAVSTNIENTSDLSFVHVQSGDLHLSPAADTVIGLADPAYTVAEDIDGEPRDAAPDIGADEYY